MSTWNIIFLLALISLICILTFGLLWLAIKGLGWFANPIAKLYDPKASGEYKAALKSHIGATIILGLTLGWTAGEFLFGVEVRDLVDLLILLNIEVPPKQILIMALHGLSILLLFCSCIFFWISNKKLQKFQQSISTLKMNCQIIAALTISTIIVMRFL